MLGIPVDIRNVPVGRFYNTPRNSRIGYAASVAFYGYAHSRPRGLRCPFRYSHTVVFCTISCRIVYILHDKMPRSQAVLFRTCRAADNGPFKMRRIAHVYGKATVSRIDAGLFDYAYVVAFYLPLADSDRNLHVSFFNFVKVDTYIKLLPVALF